MAVETSSPSVLVSLASVALPLLLNLVVLGAFVYGFVLLRRIARDTARNAARLDAGGADSLVEPAGSGPAD